MDPGRAPSDVLKFDAPLPAVHKQKVKGKTSAKIHISNRQLEHLKQKMQVPSGAKS